MRDFRDIKGPKSMSQIDSLNTGDFQGAGRQQRSQTVPAQSAPGKDSWRCYALLDDWRGKMAAPEEPELSQAQTEKLLQFQVDSLNCTLTHVWSNIISSRVIVVNKSP